MTFKNDRIFGDDTTGDPGAERLAERIRDFWRRRGHVVRIKLRRLRYENALRKAPLTIESDMVNGLPRQLFLTLKGMSR